MIAGFLFGLIGLAAFIYGRKEGSWKPVLIGILLMGYPYFVADSVWLFGIGIGLTALLFFWRD
ncbi:MAG: amino acid transport protein [Candidatus Omnitrophica bacterium]|nr:amino acid transport protein [Candidatus Omnitrophota bacterium]